MMYNIYFLETQYCVLVEYWRELMHSCTAAEYHMDFLLQHQNLASLITLVPNNRAARQYAAVHYLGRTAVTKYIQQ